MISAIERSVESFAAMLPRDSQVLDVGCGLRPYEKFFSHATYIGIDVPVSGREASGKLPDHEFDGTSIPLEAGSFDAIICTEVLEHAVNPELLLTEMARVTKTGGYLLVTVPFIWGLHELPYDFRRYTIEGIKQAIEKAGYKILKQEKLTQGLDAFRMLASSEVNNYTINIMSSSDRNRFTNRLLLRMANFLFNISITLWKRILRFERIYIDNCIIAQKP